MSSHEPIPLSQVLKDEYVSFHDGEFPTEYLTWSFYKDHIANPSRFAIKLQYTGGDEAPDSLEVRLRQKVEKVVPGELSEYVDRVARLSPDFIDEALENSDEGDSPIAPPDSLQEEIIAQLNSLLQNPNLYKRFDQEAVEGALVGADVAKESEAPQRVRSLEQEPLESKDLCYVNRLLLEEAYPQDIRKINDTLSGIFAHIHKNRHSALCVSGGGIRSASFGLGIIQGLARFGFLDRFEYLSTVSGGGYLGSWLSAWIHRHPKKLPGVMKDLANKTPETTLAPEPEPVRHLRAYSNYLSPKLGLLSADTWTLVSTFFRNLLLNWLVLVPLIAAVIMIPRICSAVIEWIPGQNRSPLALRGTFIIGFLGAAISIAYQGLHRPSSGSRRGQRLFLWLCLLPLLISAVSMTTFWAWFRNPANKGSAEAPLALFPWLPRASWLPGWEWDDLMTFVAFGISLHLAGAILVLAVSAVQWLMSKARPKKAKHEHTASRELDGSRETKYNLFEMLLIVLTGVLGGLLAYLGAVKLFPYPQAADRAVYYVCFAAPLYLLFFLLIVTVFAGFSGRWTNDEDREWWARFGAWVLIAIAAWALISPLVLLGPIWLKGLPAYIGTIGGLSSIITLALGRSSGTAANEKQKEKAGLLSTITSKAVSFAGPLCAAFIVILISLLTTLLIRWVADKLNFYVDWGVVPLMFSDKFGGNGFYDHVGVLRKSPAWYVLLAECLFVGFGVLMAWWVDTNKFSLHAMYRSRLIRAYLGASNDKRNPNKFTGFDKNDNIKMRELWPNDDRDKGRKKLLHIINMALNLVSGDNLAWQQRKAESFTVSPLHAGNLNLMYRRTEYKDISPEEVEQKFYGGPLGISLGTAVTISGAAASPNMGYHSSPVVTFLLSLFNIRLGWWLGNTGRQGDNTYYLAVPRLAVRPIIEETLGLTDDKNPYVYLSDGGHFENLGLYEMVLRRCHFILISDASQDQNYTFEDLGNAVRKIRIDLGIPIELDQPVCILPRSDDKQQLIKEGRYCAIGRIRYSCVDSPTAEEVKHLPPDHPMKCVADGILIYVKPAFYGTEPRDIYQYAKASPTFPHESTADQFFSEAQLESYRMLGSHTIDAILEFWKAGDTDFDKFTSTGDYRHLENYVRKQYLGFKENTLHENGTEDEESSAPSI